MYVLFFLILCCTSLYGQQNSDISLFTCTVEQNLFEVNTPFEITYALYFEDSIPSDLEANFWNNLNVSEEVKNNQISEESREEFKYINGKSRAGILRSFTIEIKDTGTFTIPPASIEYKGTELTSEEVVLEIVAKNSRLAILTPSELRSKVFVQAELDTANRACVIGDAVLIKTVIYTQINIESIYVAEDLGITSKTPLHVVIKGEEREEVEIEGKLYVRSVISQYIYYPLETKEILISPAKIVISRLENDAKPYSMFSKLLTDTLVSNSLSIKPIFLAEESAAYAAKNGKEIKLSFNDSLMDEGTILLDVDLIGTGNPLFYTAPNLDLGGRARLAVEYQGSEYAMFDRPFQKSFRYVISCQEIGDFDIHLDWVTWNTETNKKEVLSKSIKKIKVTQLKKKENVLDKENPSPKTKLSNRDIAFVVDCSSSMFTKDFDSNRLQAIQDLLRNLIHQKQNKERFSIILVDGESFILCPLTSSRSKLLTSLDKFEKAFVNGTDLTAGLIQGVLSLEESTGNQKDIIIFTDGSSNWSYLDPKVGLMLAKAQNIRLNTVCIGMEGEFLTPVSSNEDGSFVYREKLSELEVQELKEMADKGGGVYTRIDSPKQLKLDLKSFLNDKNLLLDKKQVLAPELVNLLLQDANYRHQKIKRVDKYKR